MRKYNEWDLLKVIATILVIIGHITILYKSGGSFPQLENNLLSKITDIIYLFHMPLFITISGAVYAISVKAGKYNNQQNFIYNKFKRLLIPYYFAAIAFLVPTILCLNLNHHITNLEYCLNILIGIDCKHLWYLWALFDIFIINLLCNNTNKKENITYLIISILISLLSAYYHLEIKIFSLGMAIYYLPYFFLGKLLILINTTNFKYGLITCASNILLSGIIIKSTDIWWLDFVISLFMDGNIVVFIYLYVKKVFSTSFFEIYPIKIIIKNSFAIYLFHIPIIYILIYYCSNIPIYLLLPFIFFASIIGSIIIANIIRKIKLKYLIGE